MPVTSKTWADLLGNDSTNCQVDGRYIVRHLGGNQYRILWSFDTNIMAVACFDAWVRQITVPQ